MVMDLFALGWAGVATGLGVAAFAEVRRAIAMVERLDELLMESRREVATLGREVIRLEDAVTGLQPGAEQHREFMRSVVALSNALAEAGMIDDPAGLDLFDPDAREGDRGTHGD